MSDVTMINYKAKEAELFKLPNAKAQLVEELIIKSKSGGKLSSTNLNGSLSSKPKTVLIRPFFMNAEASIINTLNQNPKITEPEFRQTVTTNIDTAYTLSLHKIAEEERKTGSSKKGKVIPLKQQLKKEEKEHKNNKDMFEKAIAGTPKFALRSKSASTNGTATINTNNGGIGVGIGVQHTDNKGNEVKVKVHHNRPKHGKPNTGGEVEIKWKIGNKK